MFFLKRFFFIIQTKKWALLSFCFILFFSLVALLADEIAPYSFSEVHPEALKAPPFWMEGARPEFLMGTDDLGRDFLSRLIHGARLSMSLGLMVALLSLLVGTAVGLIAGYYGGLTDRCIVSTVDVMMSFPGILLTIVILAVLGPGLFNTVLAVNIITWPAVIRLVRGETLKEKNRDYVLAVKGAGAGDFRALFRHILPNVSGPLIAQGLLCFSEGILTISALGFLGLGVEPPLPEWGAMISDGRNLMASAWWLVVLPGLCILSVVLCFNIFGGILRDAWDPKSV